MHCGRMIICTSESEADTCTTPDVAQPTQRRVCKGYGTLAIQTDGCYINSFTLTQNFMGGLESDIIFCTISLALRAWGFLLATPEYGMK
jgi:hypothetical protein